MAKNIVFFTDSQADNRILPFRKDDFGETILRKLQEVLEFANKYNALLICGGDFVDRPYITYEFLIQIIQLFKKFRPDDPMLLVLGNHDLIGRNLLSYNRSALGILSEAGVIDIWTDPRYLEGFRLIPIPYTESHTPDLYKVNEPSIIVSHNMLIPFSAPYESIFLKDVVPMIKAKGNLILLGHYHSPFDIPIGGLRFINPGSLARVSRNPNEAKRIPQILLIRVQNGLYEVEYHKISCADSWEQIFEPQEISEKSEISMNLLDLKDFVYNSKVQSFNISEFIKSVAKENKISELILSEALKRVSDAELVFK
jgi:DNA repair exonuclease SbcCD nuclease subunit